MTSEEWLKGWLCRDTGKAFVEARPEDNRKLIAHLGAGVLPEVDPWEGIGSCSCDKEKELGKDIRFLLDEYEFMAICSRCDSWAIYRTRRGEQMFGRL